MALNTNQSCNLKIIVYLQVEAIVKQRDMFKVLAQQEGLQVVSFHFIIYSLLLYSGCVKTLYIVASAIC